jgi:tetratricopeptide (TPR) repeat protein
VSSDLAETMPEAPDAEWADAQIGRYKMRRLVGTGGMGVVVAAHDPELDREVAIKIIAGDEVARPIREAQAMAKLSHPNVVQVYEVIRLGARTAIVMELVQGEELGAWVKDRPWREIASAYAQACRGLAAAHRADIVHRDFKPSNALVDKDGVVRVTDFGLAHAPKDTPLDSAGTPAYMAPEQHSRGDVDARTDQWSLACSLYEALYGRRPFEGSTRSELAASVTRGEIAAEPSDSPVPRHVRAAIRRGLSRDPAKRFDTIEELASAITHRPRTTQYALAAVLGVAVIIAIVVLSRRGEAPQCQNLDAPINAVWSTQARSELRARLLAKDVGLPEVAVDRALRGLDAFATSWGTARTNACMDTQQGLRSAETLDTRMRCLDHRLASMSGLLETLATAEVATLRATNDAVIQLQPPVDCAEAKAEGRPADPVLAAELDAGEDAVARGVAVHSLGQFERGLALADRGVAAGERAGSPSLTARALLLRGECQNRLRRPEVSLATYRLAAKTAAKARDQVLVASALSRATYVEGDHLGRRADALRARPFVELAIDAAGRPDDIRATWLHYLAILLYDDDSLIEEAATYEKESLEIRQRTLPAGHVYIYDSMETLGNIEAARRNFGETERLLKLVLAARIASRGPNDTSVSAAHNNLGVLEIRRNNLLPALEHLGAAVRISEAAGLLNQGTVYNLGITQLELGRYRAAAKTFAKSLELAERTGRESRYVGTAAVFTGIMLIYSGERERGRPLLLRGIDVSRREAAPNLQGALCYAAQLALLDGDKARARTLLDEALKFPVGDALRPLVAAQVTLAERGCTSARPMFQKVFDQAVEEGERSVQTMTTAPLAECELEAGAKAAAKQRLEAEIAWLTKVDADAITRAPLERLLARAR